MITTTATLDSASLADALCQRINFRNIGGWLPELAATLELPPIALIPEPPVTRHEIVVPHRGLRLVLTHPHAGDVDVGDPERWLITEAQFGLAGQFDADWTGALPFGLDSANETPESIVLKLGDEADGLSKRAVAAGERRQSYFMDDGLVVEVIWKPELKGLERIWIVRMGGEIA
jgi:hypothetical protein